MEAIFGLSSWLALPFWILMAVLPHWRWTKRIMQSPLVVAPLAALYAALVLPRVATVWPAVAGASLGGIVALLGQPDGATIGWVHFLSFDLFVGRWIYLDSRDHHISALLIAPVLVSTLMLGPVGFLVYLIVRAVARPVARQKLPAATPADA